MTASGSPWRAALVPEVSEARLVVRSRAVFLRVAGYHIRIPLAPRVHLLESIAGARQRAELTLDVPAFGRVYEYAGEFEYSIDPS